MVSTHHGGITLKIDNFSQELYPFGDPNKLHILTIDCLNHSNEIAQKKIYFFDDGYDWNITDNGHIENNQYYVWKENPGKYYRFDMEGNYLGGSGQHSG